MQTQERRDEKTLDIVTAIGIFTLLLVAGGALYWLGDRVFGWGERGEPLALPFVVCAAFVASAYLVRRVRR